MSPNAVADLVRSAGGRIVGRTKLQKSACLLELTGVGYGFPFVYRLFGPYSEDVQVASDDAEALGLIREHVEIAAWGGWYSIYEYQKGGQERSIPARQRLLEIAVAADPVDLELAVTAAFLAFTGNSRPWREVKIRKPSKATPERLSSARTLYDRLRAVDTPKPLPEI